MLLGRSPPGQRYPRKSRRRSSGARSPGCSGGGLATPTSATGQFINRSANDWLCQLSPRRGRRNSPPKVPYLYRPANNLVFGQSGSTTGKLVYTGEREQALMEIALCVAHRGGGIGGEVAFGGVECLTRTGKGFLSDDFNFRVGQAGNIGELVDDFRREGK